MFAPPFSPYKFRHGFAVFALKMAKDIAELIAISQNLMHANISITDSIYGGLSDKDIRSRINSLGSKSKGNCSAPQKLDTYENQV